MSENAAAATTRTTTASTTTTTVTMGPIRSLFMIVVIVCLTLMVVELRGFGKQSYLFDIASSSSSYLCATNSRSAADGAATATTTDDHDQPTRLKKNNKIASSVQGLTTYEEPSNRAFMPTRLTNSTMVVIVLARRGGFRVREVIRQTWASEVDNVYFAVGKGCGVPPVLRAKDEGGNPICEVVAQPLPKDYQELTQKQYDHEAEIDIRLQKEQEQYGDMIISQDFVDVYRTLPQKLKSAYKFVLDYLPQVNWVLKVDDDFYVRVPEFHSYLKQQYPFETKGLPPPPLCIGRIMRKNTAHMAGKWKELPQYPRGGKYPPFPLGSVGHATTKPMFEYIVQNSHLLFDYQGEDVSVGIWLHPIFGDNAFKLSKKMSNDGNCHDTQNNFVVGHDIRPEAMQHCWNHRNITDPIKSMQIRAQWKNQRQKLIKQGIMKG